jgi:hypothetical protein
VVWQGRAGDLSPYADVPYSLFGASHFISVGWQSANRFSRLVFAQFLAPAGANPAGSIDSYLASPLDFQFFGGNLNKRRQTKKGEQIICSPWHCAAA